MRHQYVLNSMIIHHGYRAGSGHYYAIIKVKDKWHKFDDDKITFIEESELDSYSQKAYLLFYQKQWVYPPQPKRRKTRANLNTLELPIAFKRAKTMLAREVNRFDRGIDKDNNDKETIDLISPQKQEKP